MNLNAKLEILVQNLQELGNIAVAFSGGLDSRFVCHTALRTGVSVLALHVSGPHIPNRETREARDWAEIRGMTLKTIVIDPLENPVIRENTPDRCYHCKHAVFSALLLEKGPGVLCDGTNASDLGGYRPGLRALKELGIVSPLATAGLTKPEIRELAAATGMDRPEQAAQPCLFTRYNYGVSPSSQSLQDLDAAEAAIADFFGAANRQVPFRLRYVDEQHPVLHVLIPEMTPELEAQLREVLAGGPFFAIPVERVDEISGHFDRLRA